MSICFERNSERSPTLYCTVGLGDLMTFGIFLLTLLTYINSTQKK